MSSFNYSLNEQLDEHLVELKWSGSSDLDNVELNKLQAWLEVFFAKLLKIDSLRKVFRVETEESIDEIDISRVVRFCLRQIMNKEQDVFPSKEPDYFGTFYFIFSDIKLLAEEAAKTKRQVKWKRLKKQIFRTLGIKITDVDLIEVDEVDAIPGKKNDEKSLDVDWLKQIYRSFVDSGAPLPTLIKLLKVLIEGLGDSDEPKSWVEVWDAAYERNKEFGELSLIWSKAFQEALTAILKGELEVDIREAVIKCFTLIINESFTEGEREQLFNLELTTKEKSQIRSNHDVSIFFTSLLGLLLMHKSPTSPDDIYIKDQFIDFCKVVKLNPISLAANSLSFITMKETGNLNVESDQEKTIIETILFLILVSPKEIRENLINSVETLT